jgi:bifunctional NMN adenylyltransferase/nudix hydrolase
MNEEIGVIVGRFQLSYLHEGHTYLIEQVRNKHPRVFVFVGQTPLKCTANDPLNFGLRQDMIKFSYPNVEVFRIDDVFNAKRWSKELDRQIVLLAGPCQKAKLYGSRGSFLSKYTGKHPVEYLKEIPNVSSTALRRVIGIRPKFSEEVFREGAIWATQNQYPKVYATVDIAVVNLKYSQVLLGRKPGADLWRFPGGFSDITGVSFEEDARRELVEETHLVANDIQYIGSTIIDDPRYASQVDKIKTIFYGVTQYEGELAPGDDLEEVRFFDTTPKVNSHDFLEPTHYELWRMMQNWQYQKKIKGLDIR